MNTSGFIRGSLAKKFDSERFLIHVSTTIERQLQEWDPTYQVYLLKLKDYVFHLKCNENQEYMIKINELKLKELQKKDPYALDRLIWKELIKQGLEPAKGHGNYLDVVL